MQTLEVINFINWYQKEDTQNRLSKLPLKTQWTLLKNVKILEPIFNNFQEFRQELINKRNEEWFVEGNGKCEKINENGEEALRIKDEYLEEFHNNDEQLNNQIKEIVEEENELELFSINIDKLIESLENDEDCKININDLQMLELING